MVRVNHLKTLLEVLCLGFATSYAAFADDRSSGNAASALPWEVGGPYQLTNQYGATRTQADPNGRMQLVFFGYANCPGICSAALPMIADVADALKDDEIAVTPVLITIDPKLDTVETMGPPLRKWSDDFIGLTGSKEELSQAYKGYNITFNKVMDDPEYGPIYAHSSFVFLADSEGKVLTLVPPVLSFDDMLALVKRYAG